MSEEKDDFLREIDELLQGDLDVEEEAPLPKKTEPASVENVSNGVADLDLNSLDGGLNQTPSEQLDSNHVSGPPLQKTSPPPKTGYAHEHPSSIKQFCYVVPKVLHIVYYRTFSIHLVLNPIVFDIAPFNGT